MLRIAFLALTTLSIAAVARAADNATFLYPPDGLTFNNLDTINVSYTSPYKRPVLVTVCLKYTGGSVVAKDLQFGNPYNSSVLVVLRWPDFVSCHFIIRPTKARGNGSRDTKSHWFRTDAEARPTPMTFGLDQNTTTVANATDASSPDEISAYDSSSGLSKGAKIGIGFGVALGVLLILAAIAAAFFVRKRNKEKARASAQLLGSNAESARSEYGPERDSQFVPMRSIPLELQTTQKVPAAHELGADNAFELGTGRDIRELSAEEGGRHGLK